MFKHSLNSLEPFFLEKHLYKRYCNLIDSCSTKKFKGYTENHHVLPYSMGGNEEDNLITLSARHHFIAHLILAKGIKNQQMIKALHKMVHSKGQKRKYKISNRVYEYLRTEHSKVVSEYSKDTVTAINIHTGEITRVPKDKFYAEKDITYVGVRKGAKDSKETIIKKSKAMKAVKRKVRTKKFRSQTLGPTKFQYHTPMGFCECRADLFLLYPKFTVNTILILKEDNIISKKFVSIHTEFKEFVGMTFKEIGLYRVKKDKNIILNNVDINYLEIAISKQKTNKKRKSKKINQYRGYTIISPWGQFNTFSQASKHSGYIFGSKNPVGSMSFLQFHCRNLDKIFKFDKNHIWFGKTPREVGFNFIKGLYDTKN